MGSFEEDKDIIKQNLECVTERPDAVFGIRMLMEDKCEMPDRERVQDVMDRHLGRSECFCYDAQVIGFSASQYSVHFAKENKCLGLITGESIGQVASQTMQSLAATNEVCTLPVYRPLIGFDKQEIIEISEKIDTYETSILPFEDCCTIFVAKHPVTKPNLNVIKHSEQKLNDVIDELMKTAIETTEVIRVE